jgi:hypothetical protein
MRCAISGQRNSDPFDPSGQKLGAETVSGEQITLTGAPAFFYDE